MDDGVLLAAVQSGDQAALADFFEERHQWLYSLSVAALRDALEAEEATARVLQFVTRTRLHGASELLPAMAAVVYRACVTIAAERGLRPRARQVPDVVADAADGPGARGALRQLVWDAVAGLSVSERVLFALESSYSTDPAGLVAVVGGSKPQRFVQRARGHVRATIDAAVIARDGRDACDELDTLLHRSAGEPERVRLTRVVRHIEGTTTTPACETCGRPRHRTSLAALSALLPTFTMPPDVRARLLDRMDLALHGEPVPADEADTGRASTPAGTTVDNAVAVPARSAGLPSGAEAGAGAAGASEAGTSGAGAAGSTPADAPAATASDQPDDRPRSGHDRPRAAHYWFDGTSAAGGGGTPAAPPPRVLRRKRARALGVAAAVVVLLVIAGAALNALVLAPGAPGARTFGLPDDPQPSVAIDPLATSRPDADGRPRPGRSGSTLDPARASALPSGATVAPNGSPLPPAAGAPTAGASREPQSAESPPPAGGGDPLRGLFPLLITDPVDGLKIRPGESVTFRVQTPLGFDAGLLDGALTWVDHYQDVDGRKITQVLGYGQGLTAQLANPGGCDTTHRISAQLTTLTGGLGSDKTTVKVKSKEC